MILTDASGRILRLVWRGLRFSRYQDNRGRNIVVRNTNLKNIHHYGSN